MWFLRGIVSFTLALAFSRHHGCVLGSYSGPQLKVVPYQGFAPNMGGSLHASNPSPTYHDQRNSLTFTGTPFGYMNLPLAWTRFSFYLLDFYSNAAINRAMRAFVELTAGNAINVVRDAINVVNDAIANFWPNLEKSLMLSNKLVTAVFNFFVNENNLNLIKSTAFETLESSTTEYLSRSAGKPVSDFSRKHNLLLKELKSTAGNVNAVVNYFAFNLWSLVGLGMVYIELFEECRGGKDKLEYTVVQGESLIEERYLNEVINKANVNKREACQFYKSQFGDDIINLVPFVVGQYMDILSTAYGGADLPSDVRLIDSVVQNMMGRVEPECVLNFLCRAGLAKVQSEPHPGVDLLLGIIVNGRFDLGILYYQPYVPMLGTPKMAEAIYRGYMNDCDEYKMEDLQCLSRNVEDIIHTGDHQKALVQSRENNDSNRTEKEEL